MAENAMVKIGGYTVTLTNTDKVLFPDDGFTKQDLINYYHRVAKVMVPHLKDRPLTMVRYPRGIKEEGFFQKEAGDYFPSWIKRATMKKYGGSTDYVICNNAATLVYLAEQNCVTPHVWLSRIDRPDNPDMMIFDMDPSGDTFDPVRRAALALRELLSELGLAAFLKSTGSRGLHVIVPLDRSWDFDSVRAFAGDIAKLMVSRDPEHLTIEQRKEKRGDRVYIDTLRNSYSQTAVPPYAVRALPGAPVAAPLDWDELKDPDLSPQKYTITNIFKRLAKKGDPLEKLRAEARPLDEPGRRLEALKTKELS